MCSVLNIYSSFVCFSDDDKKTHCNAYKDCAGFWFQENCLTEQVSCQNIENTNITYCKMLEMYVHILSWLTLNCPGKTHQNEAGMVQLVSARRVWSESSLI